MVTFQRDHRSFQFRLPLIKIVTKILPVSISAPNRDRFGGYWVFHVCLPFIKGRNIHRGGEDWDLQDAGGPQWPGKENGAMSTWTLADPVRDTALSKWTPSFLGHLSPLALSASQPQFVTVCLASGSCSGEDKS
ncbi:hypothetical protein QQP08_015899 [Theobroma cacao]|nr:hypothetical protein QQP08_015899 [Theobroma cacao]